MIYGNAVMAPAALKTVILEDGNGNELTGVVVGEETIFTAKASDIKIGKVAATDMGIVYGENTITYQTTASTCLIFPGEDFSIPLNNRNTYDYTKFQCIIVVFSSDYSTNVESFGITVDDSVFSVETSNKISDITKNHDAKSIDLNFTNTTDKVYSIRYFTYHEEVEE